MGTEPSNPRARDLRLPFEGRPGKHNAITDVPGVEVGYTTLIEGEGEVQVGQGPIRTGVTAVLPRGKRDTPSPIWAGQFTFNGNGEMTGTHWINEAGYFISPICITNTHSVGMVHHAAVGWMVKQYPGHFQQDHAWAMPVVAETYDGMTNDICGRHVREEHVLSAIGSAASGPLAEGNVGGGTGMQTYDFKGGTGTSSRRVEIGCQEYTVGVLVQSNFGSRKDLNLFGVPVGKLWNQKGAVSETTGRETGSIIVVIGSDLPLSSSQLRRIAKRGAIGIGRTGTPGGNYSGDIFLAFSVANDIGLPGLLAEHPPIVTLNHIDDHYLDSVYTATVQSIEEAILNAMIAAESMTTVKPPGLVLEAVDHERLVRILRDHGRIALP
ncbi:MAG: P1 family peptidase [Proteobacteria bacterium]|nr:P1 family peptidase [Pseudomonadota bacterium]